MLARKYFMGGTTAKGYVNFYENLIEQLDGVLFIEGGHTSIISNQLKEVANQFKDHYTIDFIYNHIQKSELEGIVLIEKGIGIFDRTKMNYKRMKLPVLKENLLNFGEGYNKSGLQNEREQLMMLHKQMEQLHTRSIEQFQRALAIHNEIEQIYYDYMDFEKADIETERLIHDIFRMNHLNKPSQVSHRYLGAATPEGPVDFIPLITDEMTKRIFLKGNSGSGKSTMLKKIARAAQDFGFDIEIYHCGFDPTSLDMVLLPELEIALFDATAPHAHDPNRFGDEELNLSEKCMKQPLSKPDSEKIDRLKFDYRGNVKTATAHLKALKKLQGDFEEIYQENVVPEFLDVMKEEMIQWIEEK